MAVKATVASDTTYDWLHPTTAWQTTAVHLSGPGAFRVNDNFYVKVRPAASATP
jgi:hypothetical protein